jgi:hypothetical protein
MIFSDKTFVKFSHTSRTIRIATAAKVFDPSYTAMGLVCLSSFMNPYSDKRQRPLDGSSARCDISAVT